MNDSQLPSEAAADDSRTQNMSALFANLVISQANLAMMMLGKLPHPHTGEMFNDLESARLFIDQLEMIEFKTKGNLAKAEADLLTRSLTDLRLAFVEAVEKPNAEVKSTPPPAASEPAKPSAGSSPEEPDAKKRFSKKY